MKKVFFALLLFSLEQEINAQRLSLIAKGGITISNVSNYSDNFYTSLGNHNSFNGGIGVEIGLRKDNKLSLQPELMFLQKGMVVNGFSRVFSGGQIRDEYQFNYLELPIPIKFNLIKRKFKAFIIAGPSVGYGLKGKLINTFANTKSESPITYKTNIQGNNIFIAGPPRFDVSLLTGLGISYKVNKIILFLEGRYGWGLLKNQTSTYFLKSKNLTFYQRFLTIDTGISIPISK